MTCPVCDVALVDQSLGEIRARKCPDCEGLWLTEEELRQVKDQADPQLRWMDFELWEHPERFRASRRDRKCPGCEAPLVELAYADTGVEVDFCRSCQGVWLEAGELDDIVTALQEEADSMEVGDYVRASLEEARDLVDGPRSLSSEWKDLVAVLRMLQYRVLADHPRLAETVAKVQSDAPFR